MKVVTSPDKAVTNTGWRVFLAGGITYCSNWQEKVINELLHLSDYYNLDNVTVFNPRRDDFDFTDKNAEIEQIKWEHEWLTRCDIFSCFFEASESIQPISLYELGRYGKSKNYDPVITVQKGYLRERDVLIQTAVDKLPVNYISGEDAILQHARSIAQRIQEAKG